MLISKRAEIETSSMGIGVSTRSRKYWRLYYANQGVAGMLGDNAFINDAIAGNFAKAEPLHRFWLKSGEPAEIRKSHDFYYVAVMRGGAKKYDIITIQPTYMEPGQQGLRQKTLTDEWVQRGPKRRP